MFEHYILVMQHFRVVCHGIYHELYFLGIQKRLKRECVYHPIENAVANLINATCAKRAMRRLGVILSNIQRHTCILIGCFFYGMV